MTKARTDLAAIERRRNLTAERRAKAKAEEAALVERLAETARLAQSRGEQLDQPRQGRGERRKPMRRLCGLEWLHRKGRISDAQLAAGCRYGAAWRRVHGAASLRSILDREVRTGDPRTVADLIAHSEGVSQARQKLALYRAMLRRQAELIRVCDRICGEGLTPREAAANGRAAEAIEAVLAVALDLLTQHLAPSPPSPTQDVADAA